MKKTGSYSYFLLILVFCLWYALFSFFPFYTNYLIALGISSSAIGVINGSYGFVQMVLKIPIGIWADRRGTVKPFIVVGMGCAVVALLLMGTFTSSIAMFFGRVFTGFAATMWALFMVFYTKCCKESNTTIAIANLQTVTFVGKLLAFIAYAFIDPLLGVRAVFYIAAAVAGIGFLGSFFIQEVPFSATQESQDGNATSVRELLGVIKSKNLILCSAACTIFQIASFATTYNYTQVVAKDIGATSPQLSAVSTIFLMFNMLSSILLARETISKIPRKFLVPLGYLLFSIYCYLVPKSTSLNMLYAVSAIGGLSGGIVYTRLTSASLEGVPTHQASTAMGYYQGIYASGIMGGPVIMGAIVTFTNQYAIGFNIMAAMCLTMGIICYFMFHKIDAHTY